MSPASNHPIPMGSDVHMRSLQTILKYIDNLSEGAGLVARWTIIPMVLSIFYESVARYLFNSPTMWAHPLSQMLWGFYIVVGGTYALRHGAHVSCDILYRRLAARKRAIMDLFTHLLFFVFVIAILLYAVPFAWESVMKLEHFGGHWKVPKWPIKLTIPVAVSVLLLQGIAEYTRNAYTAITGREIT